jgi:hypothetical protein
VKRAHELIYTAERQASHNVGLAGLRLKPGSSHYKPTFNSILYSNLAYTALLFLLLLIL